MKNTTDSNNEYIFEGERISGYSVKRVVRLPEISSFYYELEHAATGAGHIHIGNNDRENAFCVAFKTVPADSTGVAHILEHTVLCGSRKFPVRDPFFSMIKRSLNTFMNAFTASDWTMYPYSTQNKKDFYNLMDVYLDAAFFPLLDELSFRQEGHRLELVEGAENGKEPGLVYKGIVYNEMKGAMSSPDQVLSRAVLNALYPLTTYSFNSGGDPARIPSLTHDDLKRFHGRHYHPSNSFFYTYGNIPLRESLSFVEEKVLSKFERTDPGTEVPLHPRWSEPKRTRYYYPLAKNEDPLKKNQVCIAWLTADINNIFEVLVLVLLEHILLGNASSPLRKALIDSGLGSSLCDSSGYDPGNRDTMFVCGLKDVRESDAEAIEKLVFETLSELAGKGIDKELIESAIHQIEFHRKEITNTPYPYGIKLMLSFAGSRLHGGDPSRILNLDEDLKRLREELSKGPLFENRIREYFIGNPHRVLLTLSPDHDMGEKESRRVAEELEKIKAGLSKIDIEKIRTDAKSLEALQGKKEDLSCLPTLQLSDIPPSVEDVKETASYGALPVSCYEQPTGGIFYFASAAGTGLTDERLIPLIPFFCFAFSRTGTAVRNYSEMAKRIDAYTGGIGLSANARTGFGISGSCVPFVSFNGKCLTRNVDMMFDIIKELLFRHDYSDLPRLKNLLLEYRAGLESMVVPGGHRLAISLASRNFSNTSALNEKWNGIHQLLFIKKLTEDLSGEKLKLIADDLAGIASGIMTGNNFKTAVIGDGQALSSALPHALSLSTELREGTGDSYSLSGLSTGKDMPNEGWSTSSAVSFVACVFNAVRMEHEDAPALAVTGKLLKSMYLHREIREKGGAYGGYSIYSPEDGLFSYASYRDPHIINTLRVYRAVPAFIRSGKFSDEDVKEAVLQVCAETDKPDPPGPAARKAFYRKIVSLSDELRARYKSGVLAVTREKVIKTAEKYFGDMEKNCGVAVISGEEQLESANEQLGNSALKLYKI
ncbi:MAG: presequence protease [Thermodesulfobacteriota bacterium]|nr:presequence protease [Thermodesulfobacteriota bacterium]